MLQLLSIDPFATAAIAFRKKYNSNIFAMDRVVDMKDYWRISVKSEDGGGKRIIWVHKYFPHFGAFEESHPEAKVEHQLLVPIQDEIKLFPLPSEPKPLRSWGDLALGAKVLYYYKEELTFRTQMTISWAHVAVKPDNVLADHCQLLLTEVLIDTTKSAYREAIIDSPKECIVRF